MKPMFEVLEAGKIMAIGKSEAEVIKLKIASMESGNYAFIEVAKALASTNQKLVPDIVSSGGNGTDGSLVNLLISRMLENGVAKNGK